jgi:flagellar hook-basal body complex protein FliE
MSINPISTNIINLLSDEPISVKKVSEIVPEESFSNILNEALDTARATDTADKISALELLTGQTDDMSGLLLDAQKAEIALNLALQIRNKLVDAYNDILRMSV